MKIRATNQQKETWLSTLGIEIIHEEQAHGHETWHQWKIMRGDQEYCRSHRSYITALDDAFQCAIGDKVAQFFGVIEL